jgi:hypothetical protein
VYRQPPYAEPRLSICLNNQCSKQAARPSPSYPTIHWELTSASPQNGLQELLEFPLVKIGPQGSPNACRFRSEPSPELSAFADSQSDTNQWLADSHLRSRRTLSELAPGMASSRRVRRVLPRSSERTTQIVLNPVFLQPVVARQDFLRHRLSLVPPSTGPHRTLHQ